MKGSSSAVARALLSALTDSTESIRITGAHPDTYLLEARGTSGAPVRIEGLPVGPDDKHVGDLVLPLAATLRGQVLVPDSMAAGGLQICLDALQSNIESTTDSAGRFRFEDLSPGRHTLLLLSVPGRLAWLERTLEVTAGKTESVILDARQHGL